MKRLLLSFAIFASAAVSALACDICGSPVHSSYVGLVPRYSKHFIGIRHITQEYRFPTYMSDFGFMPEITNKVVQFSAGLSLGKGWRTEIYLPYITRNISVKGALKESRQGLGDLNLTILKEIINPGSSRLQHSLSVGGGFKLPTGAFDPDRAEPFKWDNYQLSSKTLDFSIMTNHNLQYGRIGLNTSAAYFMNGTNKYGFKYGDRFSASSLAYVKLPLISEALITMSGGLRAEWLSKKDYGNPQPGNNLVPTAGVDLQYKRIVIGGNMIFNHDHNLPGLMPGNRTTLQLIYAF